MAANKVVSPLHKVIDARRWDAEGHLGRLIVVIHATFLDAGFVALPLVPGTDGPVPREAGRTASSLSLRYTAPQLLHRPVAVLRQQVYGRKMVLDIQCDGRAVASGFVVDAPDAAQLLSRGLDATARALRRDATLAALWHGLLYGLCRRALVDLCRFYGVALEPTFLSLPDDAKAAILARLTQGGDLGRVECTCTTLRRLVADRDSQLWKPRYEALIVGSGCAPDEACDSLEKSWKERYVSVVRRWWRPPSPPRPRPRLRFPRYWSYRPPSRRTRE